MFPNPYHVYLHDTPSKSLFGRNSRALSHGCIRVQSPLDLGRMILANDLGNTITDERIDTILESGMNLSELKVKSMTELMALADEFNVENASSLRKQELIFAIL